MPFFHEMGRDRLRALYAEAWCRHRERLPLEPLHLGLHLAIREQVGTDRPAGIGAVHGELTRRLGDRHAAEHRMIECLAEALWQSQRTGQPPDEAAYLAALKRAAGIGG